MNKTFPLATTTWDQREFSALQKVIESNKFSMGTEVSKFEKKFANFFSTKYAVMTNSGSSANLIMIASLFYSNNSKSLIFQYSLEPLGIGRRIINGIFFSNNSWFAIDNPSIILTSTGIKGSEPLFIC